MGGWGRGAIAFSRFPKNYSFIIVLATKIFKLYRFVILRFNIAFPMLITNFMFCTYIRLPNVKIMCPSLHTGVYRRKFFSLISHHENNEKKRIRLRKLFILFFLDMI